MESDKRYRLDSPRQYSVSQYPTSPRMAALSFKVKLVRRKRRRLQFGRFAEIDLKRPLDDNGRNIFHIMTP
jgi:hypothetical protein